MTRRTSGGQEPGRRGREIPPVEGDHGRTGVPGNAVELAQQNALANPARTVDEQHGDGAIGGLVLLRGAKNVELLCDPRSTGRAAPEAGRAA